MNKYIINAGWISLIFFTILSSVNALQANSDNVDFRFNIVYSALNETNSNNIRLNLDTVATTFSNDNSRGSFGLLNTTEEVIIPEETITSVISSNVGTSGGGPAERTKISGFDVSSKFLKSILVQSNLERKELEISNTGDFIEVISIEVQNMSQFITLSENVVILNPSENKTIGVNFYAPDNQKADVYFGKIILKSMKGDQKIINLILEIKDKKALFDIKTEVEGNLEISRGEYVEGNIFLYNIGDLKDIDIELYYAIRDLDGNDLIYEHESLSVNEQKLLKRKLKVPESLKEGIYLFYTKVEYQSGLQASSSSIFEVGVKNKKNAEDYMDYGLIVIGLAIVVLLFLILIRLNPQKTYMKVGKHRERDIMEELRDYIKKELKNGMDYYSIREELLKVGWPVHIAEREILNIGRKIK